MEPELNRTRKEQARQEVGRTHVSPAAAWGVIVLFLLTLYSVPVWQHVEEIAGYFAGERQQCISRCIGCGDG